MRAMSLPASVAAALDGLGIDVTPVRYLAGLRRADGTRVTNVHDLELAGCQLLLIGPGRCPSRKREDGGRSWRCSLRTGHEGGHRSTSGHRTWPPSNNETASQPAQGAVAGGHHDLGAGIAPGAQVTTREETADA